MFYTILFGLYNGVNLDYGSIIRGQFVQSTSSTTRYTEILCARFWSIVVKKVLLHYNVPIMKDSMMAEIPTLHTTTFVMSDQQNFSFVGSIPEVMLSKVPMDKDLIRAYCSLPLSGIRPIHADLKQVINVGDKPKRGGK